ncbi:hypothetical protein ACGFNP_32175 [Nonomuraea sp. NPDC049269]|uniref:hypothetical protein n=1 Tax=Nonomuraea sp. NPDC049269 TaxID=3364349 RepID=UPI0037162827
MLVVLAIAALAILACVVLVSLGRGGELTEFPPDVPPLDLPEPGQLTAVDFMALQLPVNLVGYHTQSVDETLRRAATAISARDTRIAVLEQRVSELLSSRLYARQEVYAAPGGELRTEHEPPAAPFAFSQKGDSAAEPHGLGDRHAWPYEDEPQDADGPENVDGPQDAAVDPSAAVAPSAAAEPGAAVAPEGDATPPGAQPHAEVRAHPGAQPDAEPGSHFGGADVRVEAHPDATAAFDAAAAAGEHGREAEPLQARPAENRQERDPEPVPVPQGENVRERDADPVPVPQSGDVRERDAEPVLVPAGEDAEKHESEPVRALSGEDREHGAEPVRVAPGEDGDERK